MQRQAKRSWKVPWFARKLEVCCEDKPDGGHLDPRNQLKDIYGKVYDTKELEKDVEALFPVVRILVLGKSGSGKSTLIRLLVGDRGPQTMSEGTAGKQNIAEEWRLHDGSVPLVIHDSNGMDDKGQARLHDIENFLDKMKGICTPVHLVWYVVRGLDNRLLDDGDILGLICRKKIPVLLVITHNDYGAIVQNFLTDELLEKLLQGMEDKKRVKEKMVKVGNRVEILENGELKQEQVDVAALRLVSQRTMELMNDNLRVTWIAAQVVDMHAKLEESAKLIVGYKKRACYESLSEVIPVLGQLQMSGVFLLILKALCKIWRVPPNFELALSTSVAQPEGAQCIFRHMFRMVVGAIGLIGAVAGSAISGGVASPAIVIWLAGYGAVNARASMAVRVTFASVILGCITYVSSVQLKTGSWDEGKSVEDYKEHCKAFAASQYQHRLTQELLQFKSVSEVMFRDSADKDKIKALLIKCFKELTLNRPKSLQSLMGNEKKNVDIQMNTS